jgi:hypothetical protein
VYYDNVPLAHKSDVVLAFSLAGIFTASAVGLLIVSFLL